MARRFLASAAVVIAVVGGALTAPEKALAHASFVGASPQAGSRVETSPTRITLRFTEPLNRRLSAVEVIAVATGERVSTSLAADETELQIATSDALRTGAYRVEWHTVSTEDGHALEGSFSFGVRAAAAAAGHSIEQSPLARGGELRAVLRWFFYVAALLFVAALLLPLLVGRGPDWLVPDSLGHTPALAEIRLRPARLTGNLGWLAVITATGATLAEAADAARSLSPTALRDFLLASPSGAARLTAVLLLTSSVLFHLRTRRFAAAVAIVALGAVAFSGHAASASPRGPSVLNDWLHLVAGAAWLGGIGLIALIWVRPLRRGDRELRTSVAREVLIPFGRVAIPAFAVVTATGLVSLVTQVGQLSALWRTDYGRLLSLKIGIVALIALASALHALWLRPRMLPGADGSQDAQLERRHWRLVFSEPVLAAAVVGVVGLLVAFPLPPRQLGDANEALAATPTCDPCPLPKPKRDELAIATRAGSHLLAAWVKRSPQFVTGTLRVSDVLGRPAQPPLRIVGAPGTESCGEGCYRFRLSPALEDLSVDLIEKGRSFTGVMPLRWKATGNLKARRLLVSAQKAMRRLRSVRQVEEVTSGPGSYARTDYRLRAPDRMAFETDRGNETVIAGKRQWFRPEPGPWQQRQYGAGLTFSTRTWFRWTTYARSVRLLERSTVNGREVATLALFDEATPAWLRLTIDTATDRVTREQVTAKGHFVNARYFAYNRPLTIALPKTTTNVG